MDRFLKLVVLVAVALSLMLVAQVQAEEDPRPTAVQQAEQQCVDARTVMDGEKTTADDYFWMYLNRLGECTDLFVQASQMNPPLAGQQLADINAELAYADEDWEDASEAYGEGLTREGQGNSHWDLAKHEETIPDWESTVVEYGYARDHYNDAYASYGVSVLNLDTGCSHLCTASLALSIFVYGD